MNAPDNYLFKQLISKLLFLSENPGVTTRHERGAERGGRRW
jgi:hypothetical protein